METVDDLDARATVPCVQAVKGRAGIIGSGLEAWLAENTAPEDGLAAAAALMELAVIKHVKVMGGEQGGRMLAAVLDSMLAGIERSVW